MICIRVLWFHKNDWRAVSKRIRIKPFKRAFVVKSVCILGAHTLFITLRPRALSFRKRCDARGRRYLFPPSRSPSYKTGRRVSPIVIGPVETRVFRQKNSPAGPRNAISVGTSSSSGSDGDGDEPIGGDDRRRAIGVRAIRLPCKERARGFHSWPELSLLYTDFFNRPLHPTAVGRYVCVFVPLAAVRTGRPSTIISVITARGLPPPPRIVGVSYVPLPAPCTRPRRRVRREHRYPVSIR